MAGMFPEATSFNQDIGAWDVVMSHIWMRMLSGSGISTANYDAILQGWSAQTVQNNINLGAGGLFYCNAEAERQSLIDNFGWTIEGDAVDPNCSTSCEVEIIASATEICAGESVDLSVNTLDNNDVCDLPVNLEEGLIMYLPFCENAQDISGNSNNGLVSNSNLTEDRFNNPNQAYLFSNSNQSMITVNPSTSLNITQDITFSAWFYPTDTTLGYIIDRDVCGFTDDWGLQWLGGQVKMRTQNDENTIVSGVLAINNWYHVLVTRESGVFTMYIDSEITSQNSGYNYDFSNTNNPIRIGDQSCTSPEENFDGKIDDVAVWNRALSSEEVLSLYQNTPTTTFAYLWSTGDTTENITVTPTETTEYWVDVTTNGVTCREYITINVINPEITASATEICAGESVDLTVSGEENSSYLWSTGETGSLPETLVDEYSLVTNTVSQNTFSVIPGTNYRLEITGTISVGGGAGNQRDAAYFIQTGFPDVIEGTPYNSPYSPPLPEYVNYIWSSLTIENPGLRPTPDIYDPINHTYSYPFTPTTTSIDVGFYDSPLGDNQATVVTFKLYKISSSSSSITVTPSETTEYWVDVTTNGVTCREYITINVLNPEITASATEICAGESVDLSVNSGFSVCDYSEIPSNLQNGLVGYWPFCNNANDESLNNNNGSVNGATLTTDRFGSPNSAYEFTIVDSYINAGNNSLLQFNSDFSYSVHFNVNEITTGDYPDPGSNIILNNEGLFELGIDINGNLAFAISTQDPTWSWINISTILVNEWNHLVFTYQQGIIKIFFNGSEVYSYSGSSVLYDFHPELNDLRFGDRQLHETLDYDTSSFNGKIDDVALWDRALTTSEIQQLTNNTTYLWSTGDTTPNINVTPSETTEYWVDVTINGVTCRDYITINVDAEDPTWVIPPSDLTVACDGSGNTTEFNNWLNNTFSGIDNCGSVTITTNSTGLSDDCGATGTETVTFTLTDSNNNAITLDATFTIVDTTDPTMDVAASDSTVECDGTSDPSGAFAAWLADNGGAEASDGCSGVTWTNDSTGLSDACGANGSETVTFTATDACGNFSSTTATFTTEDTTAPVIGCPGDVTAVTEDGDCGAIVNFQPAVAIDNCGSAFTYQTGGLASGSVFPVGDTLIEYTAQDDCGNLATCTFTVTVIDDDAPVAICQDITVILDDTGNATITADQLNFGSNDNCGVESLAINVNTFDCSNVGANQVTLTVTDIHGNTATCVASVTVLDNTAPIAVCQDITLELGDDGTRNY